MCRSLERPYRGPVDPGCGRRLSFRARVHTISADPNTIGASIQSSEGAHRGRSTDPPTEESDRGSASVTGPVCEPDFCYPKEGRLTPSSVQFETIEPVYKEVSFQDGGDFHSEGVSPEGRLVGHNRFERCLLVSGSGQGLQEVPQVYVGRQNLPIHLPALRALQCPKGIHKTAPTSNDTSKEAGPQVGDIFRRPSVVRPKEGLPDTPGGSSGGTVGESRFRGKPAKVTIIPAAGDSISGVSGELKDHEVSVTPREGGSPSRLLPSDPRQGPYYSERVSQSGGVTISDTAGSAASPTILPTSPAADYSVSQASSFLQYQGKSGCRCKEGLRVVDTSPQGLEWTEHPSKAGRLSDGDRCIQNRLGSELRRNKDRGILVTPGAVPSYQLLGASGRGLCNEDLHEEADQCTCAPEDGQSVCSLLHQQDGGNLLPMPNGAGLPAMGVVFAERNNNFSGVPARPRELCGRYGVPIDSDSSRVETSPRGVQLTPEGVGTVSNRPVCHTAEPSVTQICQLETKPVRCGNGRIPTQLERSTGVCLSSLCSHRQVCAEDTRGAEYSGVGDPPLASATLVSSSLGSGGRPPVESSQERGPPAGPPRQVTPAGKPGEASVSRLESVKEQLSAAGVSQQASDLLVAGWSQGTNATYESAWKRWLCWCSSRQVDPLSCGIHPFLDFIGSLFTEGLQFRSINAIRSAVSMTHNTIEGTPIGQHPLVRRLLKGVYHSRPPQPRYAGTWEVDKVVDFLANMGENKDLSLKSLSRKLCLLMALVAASRTSELHALDLKFRVFKPEGVLFKLSTLTKKRKVGAPLKECFFGAFTEDKGLCVVECLREYEKRTLEFRQRSPEVPDPLFLSYVRPHKPVSSQQIAHWIKDILQLAGVDTAVFSAHSVRGASTSAALSKGIHLADILGMADWSRDSTFKRFYYRPSSDGNYAQKVLSQ